VPLVVTAYVAIREGRKDATEATTHKENDTETPVGGVAITTACHDRVQELEHENCACRKQLYEAAKC